MSLWRQITYGLRALFHRQQRAEDLTDELTQYFEEAEAELRAQGLSAKEARRAARVEAGTLAAARDTSSAYGWENHLIAFFADLRFAARQLWKHKAFSITAILTLALGIGANTAIFTVVQGVLLSPLPYRHADRLALLQTNTRRTGKTVPRMTGPDAVDLRQQAKSMEAVSLYFGGRVSVQLADHGTYTVVTFADPEFGHVFDLQPVAGRLYTEADASAKHLAMVSEPFARDNFGSAQAAVGKVLHMDGGPQGNVQEIVGVLPAAFDYPNGSQVWVATPMQPDSVSRTAFNYRAVARLRDDVDFPHAEADLDGLSSRLQAVYPKENNGKVLTASPLKEALTGDTRGTLMLLWGAAGFILLIACVNVMHLELVRSMERQRELAIRRALGSSRWRVMQPVFLESMLVALIGGAAGVLLAYPAVHGLVAMAPKALPRMNEIHVNLWVLGFAVAAAFLTAVLSAMLPAIRAAKVDPADALKSNVARGGTKRGAARFRDSLVVAEVAATFVLAVGAGLLLKTMMTLHAREMGYQTHQMLVVDADVPASGLQDGLRAVTMFNQLFADLHQLPGVDHVAGVMGLPTGNYGSDGYYETRGGLPQDHEHPAWANFTVASPDYFAAMGIPIQSGRDFTSTDTYESGMVAIISESVAKQNFGDADPVGKQIRCGLDSDKWMTIIGVVGDVRQKSPAEKPGPAMYMPLTQHPFYANQIHIVLQTRTKPLSLMNAVDERITRANPMTARRYTTMDELLDKSVATERFRAVLISIFAGVGLLLAMVGVYGTMAYSVTQRRFEFGLRMALGAERGAILRLVLGHASRMTCAGVLLGLVLSYMLARTVANMLVGVSPTDPASLALVSALLLITALAAALGPGTVAARGNPMAALRAE